MKNNILERAVGILLNPRHSQSRGHEGQKMGSRESTWRVQYVSFEHRYQRTFVSSLLLKNLTSERLAGDRRKKGK